MGAISCPVRFSVILLAVSAVPAPVLAQANSRLTSQPVAKARPASLLPAGYKGVAAEPKRFALADGGTLFIARGTELQQDSDHQLTLKSGEVFVSRGKNAAALLVKTPKGEVRGGDSSFAVRADGSVTVARGSVRVSGLEQPLLAGQQVDSPDGKPVPARRLSHLLHWTRDLLAAGEAPLVPDSDHAGGALLAVDPNGQEAKLELRKFHIDVHIEDGFARTTIDQTYFNHDPWQMEGTFYFPLPPDASLSRLAMYVDGQLMEGGMAESDHARTVYESIRYMQRDPALLEWVDGSTFKMRVFPIEGRKEKRILLSYTQRLPSLYGQMTYRFPTNQSDLSLSARVVHGSDMKWTTSVQDLQQSKKDGDLFLTTAKSAKTNGDVVLTLTPAEAAGEDEVRFSATVHEGQQYLMLRYRPKLLTENNPQSTRNESRENVNRMTSLKGSNKIAQGNALGNTTAPLVNSPVRAEQDALSFVVAPLQGNGFLSAAHTQGVALGYFVAALQASGVGVTRQSAAGIDARSKHYVFLVETSGDRDPLLARTQIDILRHFLTYVEPDDTFNVLTANTRTRFFAKVPLPATQANIDSALAFLESAHLIGALDVGQTFLSAAELRQAGKPAPHTYLIHLGSGIAAMGERRNDVLAKMTPKDTHYIGVGVGKRWNRSLMKAAAERTGGYFTQINPDEPIVWRAFELFATLNTPRLLNVQVFDQAAKHRFLLFDQMIAQGEEIAAIARIEPGVDTPKAVVVSGTLEGKPFERTLPVQNIREQADYLPRMWAKLEIDRLLIADPVKNKDEIIALSKAMYVMSPYTSLLVLENEDMYKQYNVDRGRKDHWAMYPAPAKIPVVYEPLEGTKGKAGERRTVKDLIGTVMMRRTLETPAASYLRHAPAHMPNLPDLVIVSDGGAPDLGRIPQTFYGRSRGYDEAVRLPSLQKLSLGEGDFRRDGLQLRTFGQPPREEEGHARNQPGRAKFIADALFKRASTPVAKPLGGVMDVQEEVQALLTTDSDPAAFPLSLSPPGVPAIPFPVSAPIPGPRFRAAIDKHTDYIDPADIPLPSLARGYSGDERIFTDLIAYTSGMHNNRADIENILETESLEALRIKNGRIDPEAAKLFQNAQKSAWQRWSVPAGNVAIVFHGDGRYAYETVSKLGIREQVVCDGKELRHLYPQLYVGAKRPVSRFHRADFAEMVPWYLPPVEDFARGADVQMIGERTVAVAAHREKKSDKDEWLQLHLVFGADGSLAERQLVRMPANKVLARLVCSPAGVVTLLDEKGKEISRIAGKLEPASAPTLTAETKDLVVLPLPYRSREYVQQLLKMENRNNNQLTFAEGLQLFAAHFAAGDATEANNVFQAVFHQKNQRSLGYYVLLAACGQNLDSQNTDVLAEHLDEPLAQYLALHTSPVLRKHAAQWAVSSQKWQLPFLQHLAGTHALYQRWQSEKVVQGDPARVKAELQRALEYVQQNKDSLFGWAMLCLIKEQAGKKAEIHQAMADAWLLFEKVPGLAYAARYEHARGVLKSGQADKARLAFVKLFEDVFKKDRLPEIDADFRTALLVKGEVVDVWSELLERSARELIAKKAEASVFDLAWQCWQVEDKALANHLIDLVSKQDACSTAVKLAALDFYWETAQYPTADQLLEKLLQDAKLAKRADLWRFGVKLADQRSRKARSLECLEKALDLEQRSPPEVINLETVREDYASLLRQYQNLADAMVTLNVPAPADFMTKVVRSADRWRAVDPGNADACNTAASILQTLGDRPLAWDYMTTPIGLKPNESGPWLELAGSLRTQGELELAELSFKAAYEAEPTNAQILWDRAENLAASGQLPQAQTLFRQIAGGTWQPRFQGLRNQAKLRVR